MMTEQEALDKWCPMVTAHDVPADSDGETRPRCIASECMAWRWGEDHTLVDNSGDQPQISRTRLGYCGLAGKPE